MKKTAKQISIKPIALVVAIAAGATLSFAASALPVASSNSLSAVNGIVNEDVCASNTSTVISGGTRTTTTSSAQCQNRNLDGTIGFAGAITNPAVPVVADSLALYKEGAAGDNGQEFYIADVGGKREAAVTFTPSRAMSVSRYTQGNTVTGLASNLGVNVNSAVGGNAGWLTGSYTFIEHKHAFRDITGGAQDGLSMQGGTNYLGSPYDSEVSEPDVANVTFNGDGTCTFNTFKHETMAFLTKDPDHFGNQPDGNNFQLRAALDEQLLGLGGMAPGSCSYTWSGADVVSLTLGAVASPADPQKDFTWTTQFNVSKDLRYMAGTYGNDNPALILDFVNQTYNQGLVVGIRNGATAGYVGRTYLYNAPSILINTTSSNDPGFTNPLTTHLLEQQVECMSRGAITLSAAGVCSVVSEVSTCAARGAGGYGETTIGGGDGTIVDNLTTSAGTTTPTACAYTVSGTGDVQLTLTIATPEGPQPLVMTGQMSDNAEAFAVDGHVSGVCIGNLPCPVPAPDPANLPLISPQTFVMTETLLATAYDGSLAADTDSNGLTNLKEFQWAKLVIPASSVAGDTDGDGYADIVTWNQTTGDGYQYLMSSNLLRAAAPQSGNAFLGKLPANFTKVAVKDMNRDGANDILMRSTATSDFHIFESGIGVPGMTDVTIATGSTAGMVYQGLADFNRDGYLDLLLRDAGGNFKIYYLQGSTVLGNTTPESLPTAAAKAFQATADFNGDGYADILVRDTGTGSWTLYDLDTSGLLKAQAMTLTTNLAFVLEGVGDFNADGTSDVILRNAATAQWLEYGFSDFSHVRIAQTVTGSGLMGVSANNLWTTLGTADYDGNGTSDLLLFRASDHTYFLYGLGGAAGNTLVGQTVLPMTTGAAWFFKQAADYNGDGKYDFLIRNDTVGIWHSYGFSSYTAGSVWSFYGYVTAASSNLANTIVN